MKGRVRASIRHKISKLKSKVMKYDFSRCNNLRWELRDDKGFCRVFEDAAGDRRISFVRAGKLCLGLPEETFAKSFKLDNLDTIRESDKEFLSAIKFLPRDPETYTDWQVGDRVEITDEEDDDYGGIVGIAARINDIVVCKYIRENIVVGMYTCEELKKKGRLVLTDYEKELAGESKCEFKRGDTVLARYHEGDKWIAGIFDKMEEDAYYKYGIYSSNAYLHFKMCIPYNEKTWRLLGTTDNYEEE